MFRFSVKHDEAALVRRAQSGDTAAMKILYESNVQYLTAVCYRYLGSQDDAKDVLQEAFIKIFSAIGRFEFKGEGSLRSWMTRIVINESISRIRKKKKDIEVFVVDHLPDIPDEDPDPEGIPPSVLMDLISKLPPGYRTILNLHVFEQKSHKEIAAMLGIKENSSTSQYHRAKAMLAEMIRKYRNEQGLEE